MTHLRYSMDGLSSDMEELSEVTQKLERSTKRLSGSQPEIVAELFRTAAGITGRSTVRIDGDRPIAGDDDSKGGARCYLRCRRDADRC